LIWKYAGSNSVAKDIEGCIFAIYSPYSQIWLNLPVDHRHKKKLHATDEGRKSVAVLGFKARSFGSLSHEARILGLSFAGKTHEDHSCWEVLVLARILRGRG
jgi:hypothetical protein